MKRQESKYPMYLWTAYGLNPVPEYKFCDDRKFRFDWAFIGHRCAVEIDGGIWRRTAWGRSSGAHSRPQGILRDMEKQNLAGKLGWRVFRFTPDEVASGTAQMFMKEVFEHNGLQEAA